MTEEDATLRTENMTDTKPLLVFLQDHSGSAEFWTQQEVLTELRSELLLITGVSEDLCAKDVGHEPISPPQKLSRRRSWFSRGSKSTSQSTESATEPSAVANSGKVQVNRSDIYVRRETELGLLETITIQAILVSVMLG